ncbi:MAG: hypothetical protein HC866_23270 [Leptolyngbyaceae cyanobacterium RU_5_1]|nr:hypothetical protein [Leptolyngbyaceae cyanobacterium RU_5_1]
MDDLFDDAPSIPAAAQAIAQSVEEAAIAQPSPTKKLPIKAIPPFKPQLFQPETPQTELPPFQLEPLDNLYTEPAASPAEQTLEHINNLLTEPAIATSGSSSQLAPSRDNPNARNLDAAFESLLGPLPPSAAAPDSPSTSQSAVGKKRS